jgi:predicted nucleotidyltransferase
MDLEELKIKYATNEHREQLYTDLMDYLKVLENELEPYMVILFGSYITEKDEPKDIDMLIHGYYKKFPDYAVRKSVKGEHPIHSHSVNVSITIGEMILMSAEDVVNRFVNSEKNEEIELKIDNHVKLELVSS